MDTFRSLDPDDICLWPDGVWCYYCELHEFTTKSDDYQVITPENPLYDELSSQ